MKRDWSSEFNALPEAVRVIGCALEQRTRIQQLIAEKVRLAERHRESIAEINQSIEYAEQCLKGLETP